MGKLSILILAAFLATGCSKPLPPTPDLPRNIKPDWKLKAYETDASPLGLPVAGAPNQMPRQCWKAHYDAKHPATVWICGYDTVNDAFEAFQRSIVESDTVKLSEDRYLVIASTMASDNSQDHEEFKSLVREVQAKIKHKK